MFSDFFSLLFPEPCPGCGNALLRNESVLCTVCRLALPVFPYNDLMENPLARRLWGRLPVSGAYAFLKFRKGSMVQKLLFSMKYEGNKELCIFMGQAFASELLSRSKEKFEAVIPVPMHSSKVRSRGYNQAELIARGLSETLKAPLITESLEKISSGVSQTRKKREERYENVKKLYRVNNPALLNGKNVLLVDDVITTGATFEVCGNLVLESGVKGLSIAALAAAD